jgi:hypothetical protein
MLGKGRTTLASTDLASASLLQPANVEGRFPDTDRVMPTGQPVVRFCVDGKLLAELLQAAVQFASEGSANQVAIEVYDSARPFVVRAGNGPQEFTGVMVPLGETT